MSTVGIRGPVAWRLFRAGYEAMIEAIEPSLVLVYGERWDDGLTELVKIARYSPKGVLEMRARLTAAMNARQLSMFDDKVKR